MSLDAHRRETEVFGRALELPAGEQRAFLARECAGDQALAARVLALLERDRASGSGLDRCALERFVAEADPGPAERPIPPPLPRSGGDE